MRSFNCNSKALPRCSKNDGFFPFFSAHETTTYMLSTFDVYPFNHPFVNWNEEGKKTHNIKKSTLMAKDVTVFYCALNLIQIVSYRSGCSMEIEPNISIFPSLIPYFLSDFNLQMLLLFQWDSFFRFVENRQRFFRLSISLRSLLIKSNFISTRLRELATTLI